ncbi:hypothetical protein PTKIN_Ptkin15bG0082300 [Pterospermum kingtungense]
MKPGFLSPFWFPFPPFKKKIKVFQQIIDHHKESPILMELTATLLFEYHSPSGSKDGEFNEKLQNDAGFYDTMVLDSPENENETQLENVCFETQVVDDHRLGAGNMEDVKGKPEPVLCDLDTEIVLDSEDEGICRTKAENLLDGCKVTGTSEKKAIKKREGQSPCLDADSLHKHFAPGKEGCSITLDVPQLSVCDHEIGRLEYVVDSEEPEESSLNALCFVDNFLTFNNVDMCEGVEERTSARKKSPLVSSVKGTHCLAKIINQASPVKELGNFEWIESYQHQEADSFCKSMTASSEFGDFQQRTDKRHQNLHNKGQRSLSNKHEEKKDLPDLNNHKLMQTESASEKFEAIDTARDMTHTFDVGISTQIAAEAMEALFYGPPASCKTGDACKGLVDSLTDLPEGETKRRTHLDELPLQKIAACDFGKVAKESVRRKRSARRYNKEFSRSSLNCNYQELNLTIKPKPYKSKESKVDEAVSSNQRSQKCETNVSPSIPNKQTVLRKQLSQDEPVTHQTIYWDREATMKRIKDQPDKPRVVTNNVKEGSMLTYNRKRKRVVCDPLKLSSGKQKRSKPHSNASAEALDGKPNEQYQITSQVATLARFLRLDAWNCPKGKRTRPKVSTHSSKATKMHVSVTSLGAEEHNPHYARSQRRSEDDKTTSNNFYMKGQIQTALSRSSLKCDSEENLSRQNCKEVTGVVTNSDSAVTSIRISALDLDRAKAIQTGGLDFVDSTPFINGLKNHSFGKSLRKSIGTSGIECNTTVSCIKSVNEASFKNMPYVYHRRPCNKNLPKPSLLKELTRLGVSESICDFTRKGFRTRKQAANVRVLFSQHLDADVIEQQKKISARLGICITSCSMDATHFIADKFVRTRNMLEAIALGKPVVTHLWLDSCGQASCLLDEKTYILRDSKREKEIGFNMSVSLARAKHYPLLKDKRVCVTQNIKPNKEIITSLVEAVGGEVVERSEELAAKDKKLPDDLLIISCEQDLAICAPLLDKGCTFLFSLFFPLNDHSALW